MAELHTGTHEVDVEHLPPGLPRVVSVGRLDINTEGLLLLTTDGELARHLELPSTGWLRRYRVRAHGRVAQAALDALRSGIAIDGVRYGPVEARIDREQGANLWLTIALREGKNREVKRIAEHLGLTVNRLIRVSFGPFALGDLAEGSIEEVKRKVLADQLAQLRLAGKIGVTTAVGTGAGSTGILHGESVAEEMKIFIKAGYSLGETFRCASENGARFFGMAGLGALAVGRKATFLITRGTAQQLPRKLSYLESIYIDGAPSVIYRKNPVRKV